MQFKCKCNGIKNCADPTSGNTTIFFCLCGAQTRIERTAGGTFVISAISGNKSVLPKSETTVTHSPSAEISFTQIKWGGELIQPTKTDLQRALKAAIKKEDYERAAVIRDQINATI